MEMSTIVRSFIMQNSTSDSEMEIVKTKPLYGKMTFLWELESIEAVMADGVQRAMAFDFEIGKSASSSKNKMSNSNTTPFSYTNGMSSNSSRAFSKWRLYLDTADLEPAISVEKVTPADKAMYYKLAIKVMKSPNEETDIISFPNTNLFYEAPCNHHNQKCQTDELRKFSLHKPLDYGCSYTTWFKDVLVGDSLLLKVDFETCESHSTYSS